MSAFDAIVRLHRSAFNIPEGDYKFIMKLAPKGLRYPLNL